eukprot:jgi/Tetstr1/436408/TSEL_025239.t1
MSGILSDPDVTQEVEYEAHGNGTNVTDVIIVRYDAACRLQDRMGPQTGFQGQVNAGRKQGAASMPTATATMPIARRPTGDGPNKGEALATIGSGASHPVPEVQVVLPQHGHSVSEAVLNISVGNIDIWADAGRLGLRADARAGLQRHPGSTSAALGTTCFGGTSNVMEAGRLDHWRRCWSNCGSMSPWAAVTVTAYNRAEAGRLGLLEQVQTTLRQHLAPAAVAQQACGALRGTCGGHSADNKAEAGRPGLRPDRKKALRRHGTARHKAGSDRR